MLDAARAENHRRAEAAVAARRLHRARRARRPYLLRVGRDLQPAAARNRRPAPRAKGRQHRARQARRDRDRQYRLHHADRGGDGDADRAYGGVAGLGERGPEAGGLGAR